jgi:uroporphyrinogen-III decarboxylase
VTDKQWKLLLSVLAGETHSPLPAGFIIDSPWLPGWADMSVMDYFAGEQSWLEANFRAVNRFPDLMFLPGFWSEFGMCTEPSAFGARCTWGENELPFAQKVLETHDQVAGLHQPNPARDGLGPFVLKRLQRCQPAITAAGHKIRFAVARGPWNLASFLIGPTEFLVGLRENENESHALLETLTRYLVDWLQLQKRTFPSIDGILILDDIIGFVGPDDLKTFGIPYLKRTFAAFEASVRFFHNDALGLVCAPFLAECGVNLFNFSYDHPIAQMRELVGDGVTLLGNIPPRDVLALGNEDAVRASVKASLAGVKDTRRIILSCGGGMPPDVPTNNIVAFLQAAGYRA